MSQIQSIEQLQHYRDLREIVDAVARFRCKTAKDIGGILCLSGIDSDPEFLNLVRSLAFDVSDIEGVITATLTYL